MPKQLKTPVGKFLLKLSSLCLVLFWAVGWNYAQYQSREYIYEGSRLIAIEEAPTTLLAAGLRLDQALENQGNPVIPEEMLFVGIGTTFTPIWPVAIPVVSACKEIISTQAWPDHLLAFDFQFRPLAEPFEEYWTPRTIQPAPASDTEVSNRELVSR